MTPDQKDALAAARITLQNVGTGMGRTRAVASAVLSGDRYAMLEAGLMPLRKSVQATRDAFVEFGNRVSAAAATLADVRARLGPGRRANRGSNPSRYARLRKRSKR